jgi:hypothetical protein
MYFLAVFSPLISPKSYYIIAINSPLISSYSSHLSRHRQALNAHSKKSELLADAPERVIHAHMGPLHCRPQTHESAPILYLPAPLKVTALELGVGLSLTAESLFPRMAIP